MTYELKLLWSRSDFQNATSNILYRKGPCPTNQQLSVELQTGVAIGWSFQEAQGKLVHLQRRFLHVPLGSNVVPLLIIQRNVGLDGQEQRTVSHIKGEQHCGRS